MAPENSLDVPEGLGSAPEVSGMSRNGPGSTWKLLEGHGRFRAVPPTPLRPWPWGEIHLGCPGRPRGGDAPRGRNPPPGGNTKTHCGRFPVGRCGKVWKAWESRLDSQSSLGCALDLLATYI